MKGAWCVVKAGIEYEGLHVASFQNMLVHGPLEKSQPQRSRVPALKMTVLNCRKPTVIQGCGRL